MSDQNQEPAQEGFEVEISTLPQAGEEGASFLAARRSPRRVRTRRRALGASAFLLLLVVVLGSLPTVRNHAVDMVQHFIPSPTPTLALSADRFYIETDVPWATVTLDGHSTTLPRIGVDAPLQLAHPSGGACPRAGAVVTHPPACPQTADSRAGHKLSPRPDQ
jgi:hypothetical protein